VAALPAREAYLTLNKELHHGIEILRHHCK